MEDWLKLVDKCGLPGKFKAWIYQHGILPRLLCPFLVYSVPSSTVEAMERTINSFLRRWKGVPKSFTSLGLYCRPTGSKLQVASATQITDRRIQGHKGSPGHHAAGQCRSYQDPQIRTQNSVREKLPSEPFYPDEDDRRTSFGKIRGRVKKYYCRTFSTINF